MRKWQKTAVILLAVALVFSLAACSNGNTTVDTTVYTVADSAAWEKAIDFTGANDVSITVFGKDKTTLYMYGQDIDVGGKAMYTGNAAGYDETSKFIAVIKLDADKKVVSTTDEKNKDLPLLLATYTCKKEGKKNVWSMTTQSYTATDFMTVLPADQLPSAVLAEHIAPLAGKFADAKYDESKGCYTLKVDNVDYTVKFVNGKLATVIHGETSVSIGNVSDDEKKPATFITLPAVDPANVK